MAYLQDSRPPGPGQPLLNAPAGVPPTSTVVASLVVDTQLTLISQLIFAVAAIGYADGLPRTLSGVDSAQTNGMAVIAGKKH